MAQKCEGDLSISVGLVDGDLFRWRVCFQGPESTPFEGGLYEATLNFPDDYPYQPPKMAFVTEMFHPNSTSPWIYSLQKRRGLHFDPPSTSRGPNEPNVEIVREVEPRIDH